MKAIHALVSRVNEYCDGSTLAQVWDNDSTGFVNFALKVVYLVRGARFIDKHIDPSGDKHFTDLKTNIRFLEQIGAEPNHEALTLVLDLREAIRRP